MTWDNNSPSLDDHIADCLAGYLESIETGATHHDVPAPDTLPLEVRQEIDRAKQCIEVLLTCKEQSSSGSFCQQTRTLAAVRSPRFKSIGRFQIRDELGAGGFGIVYRAWDPITERFVALKIPRFEALLSEELQSRFEKEARAAAKLDHPNIVPVLDAGTDGMLPYIATQYCPGSSLARWLKEHAAALSPQHSAALVMALAHGVDHAHRRGVLHRDIKPSNILMVPAEAADHAHDVNGFVPRLTDFGLAKLTDAAGDMTQTGAMLGTIRYMSPEQAMGRTKAIGPRSDVYSLGAVLYELLQGKAPFADYSDLEVLQKIETDEPSRLLSTRGRIPADLQTICQRCLEKDPARRYPSAQALADDLERFLAGRPILAKAVTRRERAAKWVRRNPAWAALITASTTGAVVLITGLAWSNREMRQQRDRAIASEARAVTNEQLAQQRALEALSRAYSFDVRQAKEFWTGNHFNAAREALERHVPASDTPDMREFSWWYLNRQLNDGAPVLGHHDGRVTAVAASPLGALVASADSHGLIRLWDVNSRQQLHELTLHRGKAINALAFSPDGSLLASAADDGLVCLWDITTGTLHKGLRHGFGWVACVAFSRDGKQLASAGSDRTVRLWDVESARAAGVLKGHQDIIRSVIFGPENTLFSSSEDGEVWAWNLDTLEPDQRLRNGQFQRTASVPQIVYALALEGDDQYLVGAQWDGGYERWHLDADRFGELVATESLPARPRCLVGGPQNLLAWGSAGGHITFTRFYEYDRAHTILVRHEPGERVNGLAFVPRSEYVVSGSTAGAVRLHPRPLYAAREDDLPRPIYTQMCWNGSLVAIKFEREVIVYDLATQQIVDGWHGSEITTPRIARSANLILALVNNLDPPQLIARSLTTKDNLWQVEVAERTNDFAIDSAERLVAIPGKKEVMIVDLHSGAVTARCPHPAAVEEVEFISDSALVASTAHDGYLRIWNAETGELIDEHAAHAGAAKKLSISPAGDRILTSGDLTFCVWERPGWKKLASIPERGIFAEALLLDDGRTIAILFERGLTLWRTADSSELLDFREDLPVQTIARSSDGRQLIVQNRGYLDIMDGRPAVSATSTLQPPLRRAASPR
jgi:WD40 repeat protein